MSILAAARRAPAAVAPERLSLAVDAGKLLARSPGVPGCGLALGALSESVGAAAATTESDGSWILSMGCHGGALESERFATSSGLSCLTVVGSAQAAGVRR